MLNTLKHYKTHNLLLTWDKQKSTGQERIDSLSCFQQNAFFFFFLSSSSTFQVDDFSFLPDHTINLTESRWGCGLISSAFYSKCFFKSLKN